MVFPHCINRIEETMDMYGWEYWPNFFPVSFSRIGLHDNTLLFENKDFAIRSFPVVHFIPTDWHAHYKQAQRQCARLQLRHGTLPQCALRIGREADIFIHEAGGPPPGHSTARMAGEAAAKAGAKELRLIHYQVWNQDPEPLVA